MSFQTGYFVRAGREWRPRADGALKSVGIEHLCESAEIPKDAWRQVRPPWSDGFRATYGKDEKIFVDWRDQGSQWPALLWDLEKRGAEFGAVTRLQDLLVSTRPMEDSLIPIASLMRRAPLWLLPRLLVESPKDPLVSLPSKKLLLLMTDHPSLRPYREIDAEAIDRFDWREPEIEKIGAEKPWLTILPWPTSRVKIEEWREAARSADFPEEHVEFIWATNPASDAIPSHVANRLAAQAKGDQLFFAKSPGAMSNMTFSELVKKAPRAQLNLGPGAALVFRPAFEEIRGLAPSRFSFAHAFEDLGARAWTREYTTRNLVSGNAVFAKKSVTDLLIQRLWVWNSDLTDPHPAD